MNEYRVEILIGSLTFVIWAVIVLIVLMIKGKKSRALQERLDGDRLSLTPLEEIRAGKPRGKGPLERIGNFVSHGRASTNLWEQLMQAGYYGPSAAAIYTGIKIILFAAGLVLTAVPVMAMETSLIAKTTAISVGGGVLFFVPNLVLMIKQQKRQEEISHFLPQAVDLLEICVTSGIGLNMAWNMVANEIHRVSTILGDEMALTNFEIHLGADRAQAMRNMARRTGADELSSLAAILVQTDRFGTSIAKALKEFASSLREERHFKAEESAEKMAVKLIIPMVIFIFPAVVSVVVGPAVITIFTKMLTS